MFLQDGAAVNQCLNDGDEEADRKIGHPAQNKAEPDSEQGEQEVEHDHLFSVCAKYLAADAGIVSKTKISNEPTICAVMLIVSASMIKKMIEIDLLKR